MRVLAGGLMAGLALCGSCTELPDNYGDWTSCFGEGRVHVPISSVPFGSCEPFLDGESTLPVEIDTDSPCFAAFGEWLEAVRLPEGRFIMSARTRLPLMLIDDDRGPHYGDVDAYAKWLIPLALNDKAPYEIQVFLEPDEAMTAGAKYKVWGPTVGTCFQTISQVVDEPRWVTLGVFRLGPQASAMRLDNLAADPVGTARVQMGPVRFTLVPLCAPSNRGVAVTSGERCSLGACAEIARPSAIGGHVLRVRREASSSFSVRLRDALSDRDVTAATLGASTLCLEGSGAQADLPFATEPLMPATHLRVEFWEGCDEPSGVDGVRFAVVDDFLAADCDRPCPGY